MHKLEHPDKHSEERMWEVQRIKTALKRKKKHLKKEQEKCIKIEKEELENLIKQETRAIVEQEELLRWKTNTKIV